MTNSVRMALVIGAILAGALPAMAQYSPITAIPQSSIGDTSHLAGTILQSDTTTYKMTPVETLQAQASLDRYADCLFAKKRLRGKLAAYVRAIPNTPAMAELSKVAIDGKCANKSVENGNGVEMQIRHDTMRQALFGSMYRESFGTAPASGLQDAPPLRLDAEFDGPTEMLTPEFRGFRALGDCIVRAEPAGARAWVMTAFDAPKAKEAQRAIIPALQGCLSSEQTVAIASYTLRGMVAEALYRLSEAASKGSAIHSGKTN